MATTTIKTIDQKVAETRAGAEQRIAAEAAHGNTRYAAIERAAVALFERYPTRPAGWWDHPDFVDVDPAVLFWWSAYVKHYEDEEWEAGRAARDEAHRADVAARQYAFDRHMWREEHLGE